MNTETDERKNLPSASGIERMQLCPGSWSLCKAIDLGDEDSELAARGTRIHHALATGDTSGLKNDEEADDTEFLSDKAARLLNEWLPAGAEPIRHTEKRWWDIDMVPNFSGRVDECVLDDGSFGEQRALVYDFKSGWMDAIRPAANMQFRTYAVLAHINLNVDVVSVAAIQKMGGKPQVCTYQKADLARAYEEILEVISTAEATPMGEKLVPGENQCRYCPAQQAGLCPKLKQGVNKLIVASKDVEGILEELDNEQLGELLDKAKAFKKFWDTLNSISKKRLNNKETIPVGHGEEFYLKPGNKPRTVKDANALFAALSPELGREEFLEFVDVKLGAMEAAFKKATKLKGKAFKEEFEKRTEGLFGFKQNAPSISRKPIELDE